MAIRKSRALGCAPSTMDGSEHVFTANESLDLPKEYSYVDFMSRVLDQGQDPICVACSISAYVNWKVNMESGSKADNGAKLKKFFYAAGGGANGMTFKDALHYLRHNGMDVNSGNVKIREYSLVGSVIALKYALMLNGPCLGALPVWDATGSDEFWVNKGGKFYGGHAISIVGWTDEGFIIRNSWGKYFGNGGYVILPYSHWNSFYEVWTII